MKEKKFIMERKAVDVKTEVTHYTCDNGCNNKIEKIAQGYPYDKGWKYLHLLEFKSSQNKQQKEYDKHFCCIRCMAEFMMKTLNNYGGD